MIDCKRLESFFRKKAEKYLRYFEHFSRKKLFKIASRCHFKHLKLKRFGYIPTIAIIGAGNMGSCLAGGLITNGHPADKLWISNPSAEKLSRLHKQLGMHNTTNNLEAVQHADIVVFAVK